MRCVNAIYCQCWAYSSSKKWGVSSPLTDIHMHSTRLQYGRHLVHVIGDCSMYQVF